MLSFFKRKDKKVEKLGSDSVVDSKELLGDSGVETVSEKEVKTNLYFTPDMQISQEDRYYFQFLHNELPTLKENQLSLSGIDIKQEGSSLHVIAYIRNTLSKGLSFTEIPLLIIGPNGEKLGRKVFNLSVLGHLPGNTSTPWMFVFEASDLETNEIPAEGWKLAFEIKAQHRLDLAESWEKNLPQEDKNRLNDIVKNMQPPNRGEVNILGLNGRLQENGNIHITLLIRNGNSYNIDLKQLPLFLEDASNEVVAKGVFELEDFTVKANSSKPWTFIFPKEMTTKEEIDLSKWRAYPPQK